MRTSLVMVDFGQRPSVSVHVKGLDQLDPKQPYVFVSNHQSIYDFPILIASIPFQLRILAKSRRYERSLCLGGTSSTLAIC